MARFKIKAYDTAIIFTATLTSDDEPVTLTGATVRFLLKLGSGSVFSATATIVSATAGTVSYTPGVGFPTTAGVYDQEWEVVFSNGTILTFPNSRHNKVEIIRDLDGG